MNPLLVGAGSALVAAGLVFANVEVGSTVPNPALRDRDGVARSLVDPEKPTVFLFFDPQQKHSLEVLQAMADLQRDMEDAGIVWVGVVSDRFSPESVSAALDRGGVNLEVLVDSGDRLYGELGVRLYPSIGIADSTGTLRAYLPFAKVNYLGALEAHLRHVLGQIDDEALDRALHPKAVDVSSTEVQVGRSLKFARMLWEKGKRDKALAKAREAVETAPDLAEPHAVVGIFLVEKGDCENGRASLEKALEIDPDHAEALAALNQCGPGVEERLSAPAHE